MVMKMADHEIPISRRILPTVGFKDGRSVSSEEDPEHSGTSTNYGRWMCSYSSFCLPSQGNSKGR